MADSKTVQAMVEAVCAEYGTEPAVVMSRSKSLSAVLSRFAVWSVMYEIGHSMPEIGQAFDRNHSTVHEGLKKAALQRRDPRFVCACSAAQRAHSQLTGERDRLAMERTVIADDATRLVRATVEMATAAERIGVALVETARTARMLAQRLERLAAPVELAENLDNHVGNRQLDRVLLNTVVA